MLMMPQGRFQRLLISVGFAVHVKELGTFLVCVRGCSGLRPVRRPLPSRLAGLPMCLPMLPGAGSGGFARSTI